MTSAAGGRAVRIARFRVSRPWVRPDTSANVEIELVATRDVTVEARVDLLDVETVVASARRRFRLRSGRAVRTIPLRLPAARRHGYGLELELTWVDGRAVASSAVEALDEWWDSPRHAALTRFRSPRDTAAVVTALRDWHVTVVQLYDWMYRHYRYEPPKGPSFVDPLGRRVSHEAVRAGVRAARSTGIATLAYGSVYGAEQEYVEEHPDERVFDPEGRPLSLGDTFFINDLRPGTPWRRRLMAEYARAVRRFGFDGIHMDTYGPPYACVAADGEAIDFATIYPGLIDEGAATVAGARRGGRVLFNCVEGFPLDEVARASAVALYLELWPPDETYADVLRWIERARQQGGGKAVVIAAYISALRQYEADPGRRAGAAEAALMLGAIISAAGAYHHVIADHGRVLVEGYYPEARPLRALERRAMQTLWRFTARYVHLLSDPALTARPIDEIRLLDGDGAPVPLSPLPVAGAVWARLTRAPDGSEVLSLIDLVDQPDDRWDEVRTAPRERRGWSIRWGPAGFVAASPWTSGGRARPVPDGSLPRFRRWIIAIRSAGRGERQQEASPTRSD